VPKIIVEVMPKPALLDPQGKAVSQALERLGKDKFREVRVGKRFEMQGSQEDGDTMESILREFEMLKKAM